MALTIVDTSDAPPQGMTLAPGQRLLEVVETDASDAEVARGYVRITVTQDRQAQAIRYSLRGWVLDAAGRYVEVAGEPVSLPASEHTWMLGESDGSTAEFLSRALEQEATRLWRAWRQLAAM